MLLKSMISMNSPATVILSCVFLIRPGFPRDVPDPVPGLSARKEAEQ